MTNHWVTIKTASEILSVSIETLRNWDRSGKLKAKRNKHNQYRLYNISDLERFALASNMRRVRRPTAKLIK